MPTNTTIKGFTDGEIDDNSKGYTIYNHEGQTQQVEPQHTPIIDKHLDNSNYQAISNFYDITHTPSNTVKVQKEGVIKDYDVRSKDYKDLYDSGHLTAYDDKTNTYLATPLKEFTVTTDAPQWLKEKRAAEKGYTKQQFAKDYLPKWAGSVGESWDNLSVSSQKEYDSRINDKVAENLLKSRPYEGLDNRQQWLSKFTTKEKDIIGKSSYKSSLEEGGLQKFENFALGLNTSGNNFKSPGTSEEEASKDKANPLNLLQPLSVPTKIVQSTYKKDYSFTDALKGKQNNANVGEDILTDPLNLVGLGIWNKLSKANKFKNLDEAYQSIKGLGKEEGLSKLNTTIQDTKKIEYNPSNNLIIKSIDENSPLEKMLNKNGEININSLNSHINNNATSKADKYILQKVVDTHFPNKTSINYNELKNKISDELVELNKNSFIENQSNYGVSSLGFPNARKESFDKAIQHGENELEKLNKRIKDVQNPKIEYIDGRKYLKSDGEFFNTLEQHKDYEEKMMKILNEDLENIKTNLANNKNRYLSLPKENQTITFSNEEKFGRGSSDHYNENTLGHSRYLISNEEPNVFHVLESQSDFYQKNKLKEIDIEKHQKSLSKMEELQNRNKEVLKNMKEKGVDEAGLPVQQYQIKQFEDLVKGQESTNNMKRGDLANFEQKRLLGNTYLERLLQENMDYAAKNGQSKLRYPTSETAAKIQGYKKEPFGMDELGLPNEERFRPEHQTILKKYSEFPKMSKKIFNQEPKVVIDVKGNSWYELDIPKSFKDRKGKIKALSTIPLSIGLEQHFQNQQNNKEQ